MLTLISFLVGTSQFVISGILDKVASSISPEASGMLFRSLWRLPSSPSPLGLTAREQVREDDFKKRHLVHHKRVRKI